MSELMASDRRQRDGGFYLSNRQFWVSLCLVLGILGVTPFAVAKWVVDQAIEDHVRLAIEKHNGSADAHKLVLDKLIEAQRSGDADMVKQLAEMNTRLSRIEGVLLGTGNGRK